MSVKCEICGKEFKTTQGRRGHMTFVHQVTNSSGPLAQPVVKEESNKLEDRLKKLEVTKEPLTEQVSELSEQLSKLTEQLKSEYVSTETMETIVAELTGESESLHKEIADTYNMLVIAMRESRELCENSFSKIEGQSTDTANELSELSKTVKHTRESVQDNSASINQLNTELVSLEHTLSELENEVARVKNLTRRVPTGEIVGIQLSDKREHHFREYRKPEGLARPYRTKRDLLLGDRWVDLAEPED